MSVQITIEISLHTIRGPETAKIARVDMPLALEQRVSNPSLFEPLFSANSPTSGFHARNQNFLQM